MIYRYFIFISFKGTSYHGWQRQPGAVTVQEELEEALSTILREQISVTGAGRTDTGVHASSFCAHFDCTRGDLSGNNNIITRLNNFLSKDISVNSIRDVLPDANARFSAVSRTYKYFITNRKDPFREDFSLLCRWDLDVQLMNETEGILRRYTDFTSFSKLHSDVKTNNCRIYEAKWENTDNVLVFKIKADRFLRNMVRAIVGTTIDVGRKKITLREFEDIILANDRCKAGKSAPAKGLFLTEIEYPNELFT